MEKTFCLFMSFIGFMFSCWNSCLFRSATLIDHRYN